MTVALDWHCTVPNSQLDFENPVLLLENKAVTFMFQFNNFWRNNPSWKTHIKYIQVKSEKIRGNFISSVTFISQVLTVV